jgi:hypothetical protein
MCTVDCLLSIMSYILLVCGPDFCASVRTFGLTLCVPSLAAGAAATAAATAGAAAGAAAGATTGGGASRRPTAWALLWTLLRTTTLEGTLWKPGTVYERAVKARRVSSGLAEFSPNLEWHATRSWC